MLRRLAPSIPMLSLSFALCAAVACTNNNGSTDVPGSVSDKLIGSGPFGLHPVLAAQPKIVGTPSPTLLPPELILTPVTQGSQPVENPATVTLANGSTTTVTNYGYDGDGPLLPAPG